MRTILFVLFAFSFGCTLTVRPIDARLYPDSDVVVDASMPNDDAADPMMDADASTSVEDASGDRDAAETCAGLPLGMQTLAVVDSDCDGPFALAQSARLNVIEHSGTCSVASTVTVICDFVERDLPMNFGALTRVGTTYTSADRLIPGCEGVEYTCRLVLDSVTNEHHIDCTLGGDAWCTIDLE